MMKSLVVARWEYLEKLKSKAFLISLLVTPMIMVAMGILPGLFVDQEDKQTKIIGVIDQTGDIVDSLAARMQRRYKLADGQPTYMIRTIADGNHMPLDESIAKASAMVLSDEIEGFCIIKTSITSDTFFEFRSKNVGDFRLSNRLEESLKEILSERKLASLGMDPSVLRQLNSRLDVKLVKLSKSGEQEESGFERVFYTAYIFLMMLFFLIVTSGQLLVRSVIEEKSNRIVEILVSSCSSTELMAGKVLGLSGLGLTQMAFWALIGIPIALHFDVALVPAGQIALLVLYFILGYLFYAAVFITVGSPLTTEQEAQQVNSYVVLLLIIPIVLALPAMQHPNASWLKVLTYIPFLTPTMMALRIPIQMPGATEILATIVLMLVSILVSMWVAGRVFRIAILATGRRPRLKEIIEWVKTG